MPPYLQAFTTETLLHRHLYKIRSRNLSSGIYDENARCFWGIRTKFGARFVDREFLYEPKAGTARPIEDLNKICPDSIKLESYLGTSCCRCKILCEYKDGVWKHLSDVPCIDIEPVSILNEALFVWLKENELTVELAE